MGQIEDAVPVLGQPIKTELVATIETKEILSWLAAGWRDMRRAGWVSPAYALIFVFCGFAITGGLALLGMAYLITPMVEGFMLVGPLLTLGFYNISRQIERGQTPTFWGALTAWRCNTYHLLTAGLILMLFLMIWARLAVIIFALSFPYMSSDLKGFIDILPTMEGLSFLAVGTIVGGVLATIAFVTNVVTLPLMFDQRAEFFSGALRSVLAVSRNTRPLMVWAAVIVAITGLGLLCGFIGLAVALPLIGHASWHAYRRLVPPETQVVP